MASSTEANASVSRQKRRQRNRLCVTDDGPGIPAEACERIFERFYRVDKARSREMGGTGLGLSIVKHVTQLHGGSARVESAPGEGASFHLTFPIPDKPVDTETG